MLFRETTLKDAWLIDLSLRGDDRGFFARLFCENEFRTAGLDANFVQINTSFTARAGTLRGMHYQLPPSAEVKVVRCVQGIMWDCIIDLRPSSPTFGKWFGATLSAENRTMMYVPRGFAHGFITLSDDVEVFYLVNAFYAPELERGLRWDEPHFGVEWPRQPLEVSPKDSSWRPFEAEYHGIDQLGTLISSSPSLDGVNSVFGAKS